jgi:hypothetical protein
MPTKIEHLGHEALAGWRGTVADKVAPPASNVAPPSEDQIRAAIGALFYALSVYYVVATTIKMVKRARD